MLNTVIKNSTLYGLEGQKSAKTDIAIKDGLIAKIGDIKADESDNVIDGKGLYTLPGFVDVHSHSDYYLPIDPAAQGKVQQGVATDIGGNCGYSSAPISGDIFKVRKEQYKEQFGLELDWEDFAGYWERLKVKGHSINYAGLIGYNTLRASIVGMEDAKLTDYHKAAMREAIRENLAQGAVGMSIGLVYPPACFADREEVIEMLGEVAKAGKVFTTHIRSEGKTLIESIEEVIDIARKSGVKLHISHLKAAGKDNWHKLDRVFELIETAKAEGIDIECDRYPYIASNTGLQVLLPDYAFDGGRDKIMERLADKAERAKFTEEILKNHPEPEYWEAVMVSQVVTEKNFDLQGVTVAEGSAKRGKNVFDFIYDLLLEEKTEVESIHFCMNQSNMDRVILKDYVMVGSDAGSRTIDGPLGIGRPHPRTFGTFPRFFHDYVFDKKLVSMEEAVRKTSTAAAERFGIERRGKLIEQYFADIVMIDPNNIEDSSTYESPLAYPKGITHLFINGKAAMANGEYTGALSGTGLAIK